MKRLHRAGRRLLIAGVIAAAAAGTFLVTSLSTARATARSSAAGSTLLKPAVPRTAIPAAVAGKLDAVALQTATASGDAKPASVQAVATSEGAAVAVATPGDSIPGSSSETVYLVVMKGDFTLGNVPVPLGASAPTGHYLTFTVATGSLGILDLGLSNSAPPAALKSIGALTALSG
jgi:hypothetical protein